MAGHAARKAPQKQNAKRQELDRAEAELEIERQRLTEQRNGTTSDAAGTASRAAPEPAAPRIPSSGSGMHAGGSTGGGSVSYVSNITLPGGQRKSMRFADPDSQATNDRLLRDLAAARGVAQ